MRGDLIELGDVGRLMPMHLVLDGDGAIIGSGPTMRKLIGGMRRLEDAFAVERPRPDDSCGAAETLLSAARSGERVFIRQNNPPFSVLRGHAVMAGADRIILNLGFGIGLPQSIRQLDLTDADFAPSDLAIELLFLHEANAAALSALSQYNAQLDEARQLAEAQSATDPLTGLVNRRGLDAALSAAARLAPAPANATVRRQGDRPGFALLHLDLDGFKAVNDTYGHPTGDRLLEHVGHILREETRASDTIARTGGDEFVLLLGGLVAASALEALALRIIARIETPAVIDGARIAISTSIGIGVSHDYPGVEIEAMTRDADAALYAAKRAGRGLAYRSRGAGMAPVPCARIQSPTDLQQP